MVELRNILFLSLLTMPKAATIQNSSYVLIWIKQIISVLDKEIALGLYVQIFSICLKSLDMSHTTGTYPVHIPLPCNLHNINARNEERAKGTKLTLRQCFSILIT